jgi:hypothetical protein
MLNTFGQTFKDNGYQLMNDRDSPIWQNPSYWPVTFRITPNWHRESTSEVAIDNVTPGGPQLPEKVTAHGLDVSGLDFHTGGTLYKNISFYVLPSSDSTGAFHFETVMARLDNLNNSPWLNFKLGKFELDNIISEKRTLTISNQGGIYQLYHFSPVNDSNSFGQIGDNQLGVELGGHSRNDRTRYSVAVDSSFVTASQAFDVGRLGVDRVGGYYFGGVAPTETLTSGGAPVVAQGNKSFHREGAFALLYFGKLDFQTFYQHGWDSPFFGTSTAANATLPAGAHAPVWNGAFVETHYVVNPQWVFIQRSEFVRMSQQALDTNPSDLGNLDAYTFGARWYPIMFSRAGFAIHGEYAIVKQRGTAPLTGSDLTSSSAMLGFDFAF